MHLQRNRFVLRGRSRVQHLHTLDLKETCFLQRTVSWDSWLQYSLEQHAACQTSSISNNRLVAVVQVIQNASTPFEEAEHAMSVSGLCGCSFVTIIARTAIRRHRDIGGLESNRDSASAYICYRSFSTIDNQVCCLPWFFSHCAFDNIYRRSSTLGASSSSLSAVCCGTCACMPSAKSAIVV